MYDLQVGRIVVSGDLDREVVSEYVVVVIGRDSAPNSETQEVRREGKAGRESEERREGGKEGRGRDWWEERKEEWKGYVAM